MRFLRCHVLGFGKLTGLDLAFHPGLNVVFAPNEGGKSTLQQFLIALLYGQVRGGARIRMLDGWVEQYRPWAAADYGGSLWCELADGRRLEIRRAFGKDEHRIEIRTATGEEITGSYDRLRTGEILIGAAHLGLSKELFESVAIFREDRTSAIDGRDTLRDRIANLAQSGQQELSVQAAEERLSQALEGIGSERAPTRPLRRALDRLEGLRAEKRALEERRRQFQDWLEQRAALAGRIAALELEAARARRETASARLREALQRIRSLTDIRGQIESVRREIGMLGARPDFPAHRLEELNTLQGEMVAAERRLAEEFAIAFGENELEALLRELIPETGL